MTLADKLTKRKDYQQYYNRLKQMSGKPVAKISGLVSLTILTVAFFIVFAIMPTVKTITKLTKELESTQEVNRKFDLKIRALNKAEQLYNENSNLVEKVNKVLPEEAEFERIAWQLQWLAKDKQVVIKSGNFGEFEIIKMTEKEVGNQQLNKLSIELSISGNYLQIKEFVEVLTKIDRLITVNGVMISNKAYKQTESSSINANLKLSAYYLPRI